MASYASSPDISQQVQPVQQWGYPKRTCTKVKLHYFYASNSVLFNSMMFPTKRPSGKTTKTDTAPQTSKGGHGKWIDDHCEDGGDIESAVEEEEDLSETQHHRPQRLHSLQTLPTRQQSYRRFPRDKVVGLKDAGTLNSSWKARRKEFLNTSREMNASTDTIFVPTTANALRTIEEKEKQARAQQNRNPLSLLLLGNLAAFKVMMFYLISLETLVTCSLTAGLIVYWYNLGLDSETSWSGGSMDFIVLAFAVTSPVATALGMAFTRREGALVMIAEMRSSAHHIYLAHCLWDWSENGGRAGCQTLDFQEHCDAVMAQLVGIGDELSRFLTLPTTSRSRHRMTRQGRREAARTIEVAYRLLESMVTQRITRLSIYAERIKSAGLASGEVSRIRQYERFLQNSIERLRMYKMYRTPQALRSFARIFTFLLPPFYAPKFAQVAIDLQSLGVGVSFGMITAIGLTALFESLQVLEDPFVGYLALDGIDVREEFEVLLWSTLVKTRRIIFPDAPPYPVGRRTALDVDSTVPVKDEILPSKPSSILLVSPPVASTTTSPHVDAASRRHLHTASVDGGSPKEAASILFVDPGPIPTVPSDVSLLTAQSNSLQQDRGDVGVEEFGYPMPEDPESEEFLRQSNFRPDGQFAHHVRSHTVSSANNLIGLMWRSNAALPSPRSLQQEQ